jgi:hypothetical protein
MSSHDSPSGSSMQIIEYAGVSPGSKGAKLQSANSGGNCVGSEKKLLQQSGGGGPSGGVKTSRLISPVSASVPVSPAGFVVAPELEASPSPSPSGASLP